MKKFIALVLSCFIVMQTLPLVVHAAEEGNKVFFVSPDGSDDNDGSIDAPFKTPLKARDRVREIIASDSLPAGGVTIYFREGYYEFPEEGFKLSSADSGTEESPITYSAYNGEEVVFCGGYVINQSDFRRTTDEKVLNRIYDENARDFIYEYDLTKLPNPSLIINADQTSSNSASKEMPNELICDEEVQICSRWPNLDNDGSDVFVYTNENISSNTEEQVFKLHDTYSERMSKWAKKDWPYMYAHGFFVADWLDSRVGIKSIRNGVITTTSNPVSDGSIRTTTDLYFYNLLPELDRPGEYFIDPDLKTLYYYPSLESHKDSKFIVTTLDDYIIEINASNILVKGITFNGSRKYGVGILKAKNSVIDFCKILNTTATGIWIGTYRTEVSAEECGIRNSEIRNVSVGIGMPAGDVTNLKKANCFAENNYIYNYSRRRFTYDDGINVTGCGNRIFNNKIEYGNHGALRPEGIYNEVAYNEVTDVLRYTADAGATYCNAAFYNLGDNIHNNYYHDCVIAPSKSDSVYGIRAFYWDEYESCRNVYNNLIANFDGYGVHVNGGSWCKTNNNVFYKTSRSPVVVNTGPGGDAVVFNETDRLGGNYKAYLRYKGDMWESEFPFLKGLEGSVIGEFKGNEAKNNISVDSPDFELAHADNPAMLDASNNIKMTADEIFVDAENGDFRIKEDSTVYEKSPGFVDIQFEKMGLISDKALQKVDKSIVLAVDKAGVLNNGKLSLIDSENYNVMPFIEEDKTFVPLRFVAEALGITVEWNAADQTATLKSENKTVEFKIGSTSCAVNGETKTLQAAARVANGRTVIPLRDCSEAFGKNVAWNRKGLIVIGDSEKVFDDAEDQEKIEYLRDMLDI